MAVFFGEERSERKMYSKNCRQYRNRYDQEENVSKYSRGEEGMRGETSAANRALFMGKLDPVLF